MLKLATHFLNKYLSPYLKDIDESKLKLQLTSGSVALENLELVESVLDELDLPIRVVSGQLKRLTLKVPWTKIYSAPTVVTIDGLYILVAPKSEISYDAEKEKEYAHEEKIRQVKLFEQRAQERKDSANEGEAKSMGTVEKLAMTVVKNLQIRINNIHIRYEDGFSIPGKVLAAGAMLDSLTFDSANENFQTMLVEELTEKFFKLVQLKNFSLYLDVPLPPNDRYSALAAVSVNQMTDKMLQDILDMGSRPGMPNHAFIIAPFSATARLKLNTRPELTNFNDSRVHLDLDMETFSLGLSRIQYRTAIEMIDAVDFITLQYKYRKFRPQVPCRGKYGARQWWAFAIKSVIHDNRGLYYSATKMLEVLHISKQYRQLYFTKLTKKSISDDVVKQLNYCEEKLDAFNIVLQRRQAEMEAKRLGLLQTNTSSSSGGWFSSMFSWRRETSPPLPGNEASASSSFSKQLDDVLTPEDRAQLIKSMGLDEEAVELTNVPPDYINFRIRVAFRSLEINCYDTSENQRTVVGHFVLSTILTNVALRANKSIKIAGQFRRLHLTGINGVDFAEAPAANISSGNQSANLLNFEFDSKTLDTGDQRLLVESQPISIVFHAATVNRLQEFFKVPPSAKLQAMAELAATAVEDLKEKSAGFVKNILDERPFVDIRISLRGGYVVLPEKGDMALAKRIMVADLGMLSINAEPKRTSAEISPEQFEQLDTSKSSKQQQAVLRELMNNAYNRFAISVEPIQVLLCNVDDDWQSARGKPAGDLHLLPPLQIRALFGLCVISDPRLPATSLELAIHPSNIVIDIRDTRLRSAVVLLASIPFAPPPQAATTTATSDFKSPPPKLQRMSSQMSDRERAGEGGLGRVGGGASTRQALAQLSSTTQTTPTGRPANAKLFALSFSLSQLTCQLIDSQAAVLVRVIVGQLKFHMNVDTYTIYGGVSLHSFHFQHQKLTSSPVSRPIHNLVNTAVTLLPTSTSFASGLAAVPLGSGSDKNNLLTAKFMYADPLGPDFEATHQRRRVQLFVRVGSVELLLHREAILDVIRLAGSLAEAAAAGSQAQPGAVGKAADVKSPPRLKKRNSSSSLHASLLSLADDVGNRLGESPSRRNHILPQRMPLTALSGSRPRRRPEIVHLYIDAKLDRISAVMRTENARFGSLQIAGLSARVLTKLVSTTIDTSLMELAVYSSVSAAPEDTRQMLVLAGTTGESAAGVAGTEIVSAKLTVFNQTTDSSALSDVESADVEVIAKLAQLRLLVVQRFVENLIEYALGFGDNVANKVREASSDFAQSAKVGIQEIQATAKRIKLDLQISSPVIIIPQTPTEIHSFFAVHLGELTLVNEFTLRSQDDNEAAIAEARAKLVEAEEDEADDHEAALLNCLSCKLSGVKLVRGWTDSIETIVETTLDPHRELPLVGPISLTVELVQNLSAAVEQLAPIALKFPDIKIAAKLNNVEVSMCQGDYVMLLDVVNWISTTKFSPTSKDKETAQAEMPSPVVQEASGATVYQTARSQFAEVERTTAEIFKAKSPLMENRKVLDVSCNLGKTTLRLYSGDVDFSSFVSSSSEAQSATKSSAQVRYNPQDLLASLCIHEVEAYFVALGNENKSASVSVTNMTIDDSRPSSKEALRVTRLLECFNQLSAMKINPLVPQKPPRLIVIKYEDYPQKQDRLVSFELNNLHACVNAEFIVLLANFFISKKANNTVPEKSNENATKPGAVQPRDREATAAVGPTVSTRFSLKLSGPKFLLLDDPSTPVPAALALQFDISSDIIIFDKNIAGTAVLKDLAIYWGSYNNLKTGDTDLAQRLLKPMTIDVALNDSETSEGPIGRIRKLDITSTDLSLSVTPPAIYTISVVARRLSEIGSTPVANIHSPTMAQLGDSLWHHKPLDSLKLDFLRRSDSAYEALDLLANPAEQPEPSSASVTVVFASFPIVTVKLSTGSKSKVMPLVKLRSSFIARAEALSNGEIDADLQFDLEVAYYNDQLYIWEPLLEPVECTPQGMPVLYYPTSDMIRHRRAQFHIEMRRDVTHAIADSDFPMSPSVATGLGDDVADDDAPVIIPRAATKIELQSKDILQLVVTKIGLNVLTAVGQGFGKAYRAEEVFSTSSADVKSMYPVILYNHTDTKFTVKADPSLTCVRVVNSDQQQQSTSVTTVASQHIVLGSGSFAALDFTPNYHQTHQAPKNLVSHQASSSAAAVDDRSKNVAKLLTYEDQRIYKFTIYADDYRSTKELYVNRADSVLFEVSPIGGNAAALPHAFVCQVTASEGNMVVEFTSVVKVTNNLPEAITINCRFSQNQSNPTSVLPLQPGRSGYLPLKAIYGSIGGFYIQPIVDTGAYKISSNAIDLAQRQKQAIISCAPTSGGNQPPFLISSFVEVISVDAERQQATGTAVKKQDTYHIQIKPVVTVKNLLPFAVVVSDLTDSSHSSTYTVEAGRVQPMRHCSIPDSTVIVRLPNYCGDTWSAKFKLGTVCVTKNTFVSFESGISPGKRLDLAFFMHVEHGAVTLSLYSPYWFVNRTGMALSYRMLDPDALFEHDAATEGPMLISVASKTNAKRKIQLRVGDSEWSDKFSVDAVGSAGTCICKFKNSLTYNGDIAGSQSNRRNSSAGGENRRRNRRWRRIAHSLCCCCCESDEPPSPQRMVGLKIVLASCKLTKIITLTPFFFIVNKCPFDIQCQETMENAKVHTLYRSPPDQCIPFWPMETDVTKQRMTVTIKETGQTSVPFPFSLQDNMLLKFDTPIFGINVACYVCEGAIHITFEPYSEGLAPVLIANHTHKMQLEFFQDKFQTHELLDAKEGVLFTWPDPALEKNLMWAPYDISRRICVRPNILSKAVSVVTSTPSSPNAHARLLPSPSSLSVVPNSASSSSICTDIPAATKYYATDVSRDGTGSFQADPDTKVWWVSFMHRKQRVLLFTEDQELARRINEEQGELEQKNLTLTLRIAAVGMSLVENKRRVELLYAAITPSSIEWQYKRKRGYKAFSGRETALLENAYEQYERKKAHDAAGAAESSRFVFDNGKFEADFAKMIIKRGDQPIEIRRVSQDGVWFNAGFSDYHSHFHFRLNRIQIDNQTPDARFQTILAPVPPPKSVAAESANPKPFIELSMLLRKQSDSQMLLFKYFKILIQEMAVQVDLPFLLQIASFFQLSDGSADEEYELFKHDLERTALPLEKTDLGPELSGGQKHFFEHLHVSPLKVHLSFSPQGSGSAANHNDENAVAIGDVGAFLLSSVGIMTGDVTDAVFRLGYYEITSSLLTMPQVAHGMQSHYTQQALRQFFNVLLGFDVIGNPVGVLRGFASGVETLFYEPWQGAIQGPEELARGVAIGLQQFFGKTVGGVSGALSKMTGTLGQGVAKLTLDADYQRARKVERMQAKSVGQSLAYGGQQLVTGIFDGVTGIVRKPVEGAQRDGVEGFFKGLGVGLVGVVARPTAGVVDFASTGLDTIRRVADAAEELKRLRPPRLIMVDGIIRPYLNAEAEANNILNRVDKGRYKTDVYVGHLLLSKDAKRLMIITERGLFGLSRSDMLNQWDLDFNYSWADLRDLPYLTTDGIVIPLKERQKRLGFLTGQQVSRVVQISCDRRVAEEFVVKMQDSKNRAA